MTLVSVVRWVATALALSACASQAREPSAPSRVATASSVDAPIPTITPAAATPPPASRFETRRIGESAQPDRASGGGGRTIDLDVRDADLHDVLRLLADVGGVGLVVPAEITGRVTVTLRKVPWRQALDTIASAKGLAVERDGNVLFVKRAGPAP